MWGCLWYSQNSWLSVRSFLVVMFTRGLLMLEKVVFWKRLWSVEREFLVVLDTIEGFFLSPLRAEVKLLPS